MKDALGNDLLIGSFYGHSVRTSGFVDVVIGELIEINDKTVKLEISNRGRALYDDNITESKIKRKIVSVISNGLFPVSDYNVNWEKIKI